MQRWFLSYHSTDQAVAERLKDAIERKDSASRVFFAPTHMRAGGSWTAQLAQEIADAAAFILLIGKEVGPWQVVEYDEALDKWANSPSDFPLIVILLEGQTAPGLPFLRRLHWIITPDPSSEKDVGQLFDAAAGGGSSPGELWRYTSPYRGLEAMEEKDSDYFFGRQRETVEVLSALAAASDRIPVLLGNSGVGKSSLAQAGVLAALKRQGWPEDASQPSPWPHVFADSRRWCFLTFRPAGRSPRPGTQIEPIRSLVETFLTTWQLDPKGTALAKRRGEWTADLVDGKVTLSDLIDATEDQHLNPARIENDGVGAPPREKPPGFFLYVDQGEELYVRAEERQRRRFSEILAEALGDPRLRALMSLRTDFFGDLQNDRTLFAVHKQINVTPLAQTELLEVVSRPPEQLGARFANDHLANDIAVRAADESTNDAGTLPLLSYFLDDMWTRMIQHGDGIIRAPETIDLGRVLVSRANEFIASRPDVEDELCRIFTLKLATVREDGQPTRRRAARSEFSSEEWRLIGELVDHPNRLLVTTTPEGGETYTEVAHETIFRRWDKLRDWIEKEREFLAWRNGLEAALRAWQATPDVAKQDALLMGAALTQAQSWLAKRDKDLPETDRRFIDLSIERENQVEARAVRGIEREFQTQARVRRLGAGLVAAIIIGLIGWIVDESLIKEQWLWWTTQRPFVSANIWPHVLKPEAEHLLEPGNSFRECAPRQQNADYCPDMVVVPKGTFLMGSLATDKNAFANEFPQHQVTIGAPFAVSKFELTFAEWDACVAGGGCSGYKPNDFGRGRGEQPAINVNWEDAQQYVAWLSQMTGKTYRLLTEAEYEYTARAGTTTEYPWGDDVGKNNANCDGCGSQMNDRRTAPVGSFAANRFGLFDMVGNVWEWVEDCYHLNYQDAPADGSAWTSGDCANYVIRGGSWTASPNLLRSADRVSASPDSRDGHIGFRVARTLDVASLTKQQIDQIRQPPPSVWCTKRTEDVVRDLEIGQPIISDENITLYQVLGCTKLIESGKLSGEALTRVYNTRGNAYYINGDYEKAIADYTQAITLDPKYVKAYTNRCWAYDTKGDYDRAIADCDEAIRLKNAPSPNSRGNAYRTKGDYDRADYDQVIVLDDAYAYGARGQAYYLKGDYESAIADYTQAITLDPKYAHAFRRRGLAYAEKRDYDRAIADYDQAITLDPKYALAYDNRGDAQKAQGDLAGALKSYRDSLAIMQRLFATDSGDTRRQRDLSASYEKVGDVQVDQGDLSGALKSYRDGLALMEGLAQYDPDNAGWQRDLAVSYAHLAYVYRQSNDPDKALAALRQGQAIMDRLAKLSPDNTDWKSDLAWFDNQIAVLTAP